MVILYLEICTVVKWLRLCGPKTHGLHASAAQFVWGCKLQLSEKLSMVQMKIE